MTALNTGILTLAICLAVLKGPAEAQDRHKAIACWWSYASCATVSYGDENWRSICYARFSNCTAQTGLPECPAAGQVPDCSTFLKDCRELADGDAVSTQQCDEDNDACLLAHGC